VSKFRLGTAAKRQVAPIIREVMAEFGATFEITMTGKCHLRIKYETENGNSGVYFTANTPGGGKRTLENTRAGLRKALRECQERPAK
jgi:hypothetical protein